MPQYSRKARFDLQEIKAAVNIVEIISSHLVLKRKGGNYVGLCPFHDEKTPSFSVNESKQFFYCFGCGAKGDAIAFLMQLNGSSFSDTVRELAKQYDIAVEYLSEEQKEQLKEEKSEKMRLSEVVANAAAYYERMLFQPKHKKALDYLTKERGIPIEIVKKFRIGFAPNAWDSIYSYLVKDRMFAPEDLEQVGLVKKREGQDSYYDHFRERIMIPICNEIGQIIAFTGRAIGGNSTPKYLHSPSSILFDKSRTVWGLDQAKSAIKEKDEAIIVEGCFDAIALHCRGIENVVAALGTAFSSAHLYAITHHTPSKKLVLSLDSDNAGQLATDKIIYSNLSLAASQQVQIKVLSLPEGKDVDEYLKVHTSKEYLELVERSRSCLDWKIKKMGEGTNLHDDRDFITLAKSLVALLEEMGRTTEQSYYLIKCAEVLAGQDKSTLSYHVKSLKSQLSLPSVQKQTKFKPQIVLSRYQKIERILVRTFVHNSSVAQKIADLVEQSNFSFELEDHDAIWELALYFFGEEPTLVEQQVRDRLLFTGLMESYSWLFDQDEDILVQNEADVDGLFCVLAEKPWQEKKAALLGQVGTSDRLAEICSQIIECNQKIALLQESRMIAS